MLQTIGSEVLGSFLIDKRYTTFGRYQFDEAEDITSTYCLKIFLLS